MFDGTRILVRTRIKRIVLLAKQKSEKSVLSVFNKKKGCVLFYVFCLNNSVSIL